MRLASGIIRLPEMHTRGMKVGLGYDGGTQACCLARLVNIRQGMPVTKEANGDREAGRCRPCEAEAPLCR